MATQRFNLGSVTVHWINFGPAGKAALENTLRCRPPLNSGPFHKSDLFYNDFCFIIHFDQRSLSLARLGNACMRLSIVPSSRSRRAVSNGGPLLSVAYDLTCFITLFVLS